VLKRFTIGRFMVVGMPAGGRGPFGGPPTNGGRPPNRGYDYEASAEEVLEDGSTGPRLPRSDQP
jgi:hypothetical protein